MGLFSPRLGTRVERLGTTFSLGSRARRVNQRMAELWGLSTAVRLACHTGWGGVTLFLDNVGAIYKGVRGRAFVGLWVQQWILRKVHLLLFRCPLVVHFVFVPTFLQPAEAVSRSEASCGGCRARAPEAARGIWQRLGDNLSYALYFGFVARLLGDALGPVVALQRELEGGGDEDAWRGLVVLFDSWGPREYGCGCRSGPKTRAADVRQRESTPVIVGIGG